jgi:acyl-CoA thioester hydrolase
MNEFFVYLQLRIDWADLDLFGHVNNVAYFRYTQAARVNYWERCGLSAQFTDAEVGPLLLSTQCRFVQPLFYPGNIKVATRTVFIKNTSYGLHHVIYNDAGDVAAEAQDIIVNFNYRLNQKQTVSAEFRALVSGLEGGKPFSAEL